MYTKTQDQSFDSSNDYELQKKKTNVTFQKCCPCVIGKKSNWQNRTTFAYQDDQLLILKSFLT